MNNQDNPGLPLGFGMQLANDEVAYSNYRRLTKNQKIAVINYVRGSTTGMGAERRIADAVEHLRNNTISQIL